MNNQTAYLGPVFNSIYSFDGRKLPSDYELLRAYATNDIVYACVNYNANSVAQVPLRLYTTNSKGSKAIRSHRSQRVSRLTKARLRANPNLVKMIGPGDDVTEILEHPLLDLLNDTNNGLSAFQLLFISQVYQEIMGRAYWQPEHAGISGAPTSIYVLKPQRTMPVRDVGTGDIIGYKYQPDLNGQWESLDPDEVIDFRFPHPEDQYGWGMSPLKSSYAQGELTSKFTTYGNDLMDNRARIDGMFIPNDDMGIDMARKAEDQFAQRFGGTRKGGVWFSPTKGTFVPTRYAPTDLGPMEVDKNTTSRLCRAFGIPEPLMSANESTFSNMDKALQFHAKFTTTPRILQNEQRLNATLCPMFDERLFLAADNPIPEDNEFELKKLTVAIGAKVLTPNEIRLACDYDELADEGMDELPPSEEELAQQQLEAKAGAEPKEPKKLDEEKPVEKALLDTVKLIELNKAVVVGDMPRATAINVVIKAFGVTADEARDLVGYARVTAEVVTPPALPATNDLKKSEGPHKYASTQINLTGEIADKMRAFAASIPSELLADDGVETEPHITVLYGLHSDDPSEVIEAAKKSGAVLLKMGDLSLFPATKERDYDVLKIDVSSPTLHALHDAIAECEHTSTFSYRPHATIAYLKAGEGQKYVGTSPVSGNEFLAKDIVFSSREGVRTTIPLGGNNVLKANATDTTLDELVDSHDRLTPEERKRRKQFLLLLLAFFGWQAHELISGGVKADEPKFTHRLTTILETGMRGAMGSEVSAASMARAEPEILRIATDMAAKINGTTATAIEAATTGVETIALADAVNNVLTRAIEERAEHIEGDMSHIGKQVRNKIDLILEGKEVMWKTKDDERVCQNEMNPDGTVKKYGCEPLHGLVMKAGEDFAPGVKWPVLDTHPNCRCELVEVPEKTE